MAVCFQIHTKHIHTAVWAERGIVECLKLLMRIASLRLRRLEEWYACKKVWTRIYLC